MTKITNLFKKADLSTFLRILISDSHLILIHIVANKIVHKIEVELVDKIKIFEYVYQYPTLPLEVIISNSTMSCRSISLNNSNEKDIMVLAKNILNGKDSSINFACYEKKLSYRRGVALFCDMKLTPILFQILQEIFNVKNSINSITASPFWIVSNYFTAHPTERRKFKVQIFVAKTRWESEIIALHDEKYVYYRKMSVNDFNEKGEVNGAISFVKQLFNTSLEDVAIYSLDENAIDRFTTSSQIDMRVVSQADWSKRVNEKQDFERALRPVCLLIFSVLFLKTAIDVGQIIHCNSEINDIQCSINKITPDVFDDIAVWKHLDSSAYLKQINFKNKFKEELNNTDKKLQNVSIKIDEKTKQIIFKSIYEE